MGRLVWTYFWGQCLSIGLYLNENLPNSDSGVRFPLRCRLGWCQWNQAIQFETLSATAGVESVTSKIRSATEICWNFVSRESGRYVMIADNTLCTMHIKVQVCSEMPPKRRCNMVLVVVRAVPSGVFFCSSCSWGSLLVRWGERVTINSCNKFFFQHLFFKTRVTRCCIQRRLSLAECKACCVFLFPGPGRSLAQWQLPQTCWLHWEQNQAVLRSLGNKPTHCHTLYSRTRQGKSKQANKKVEGRHSVPSWVSSCTSPASLGFLICRADHVGIPLHAAQLLQKQMPVLLRLLGSLQLRGWRYRSQTCIPRLLGNTICLAEYRVQQCVSPFPCSMWRSLAGMASRPSGGSAALSSNIFSTLLCSALHEHGFNEFYLWM